MRPHVKNKNIGIRRGSPIAPAHGSDPPETRTRTTVCTSGKTDNGNAPRRCLPGTCPFVQVPRLVYRRLVVLSLVTPVSPRHNGFAFAWQQLNRSTGVISKQPWEQGAPCHPIRDFCLGMPLRI